MSDPKGKTDTKISYIQMPFWLLRYSNEITGLKYKIFEIIFSFSKANSKRGFCYASISYFQHITGKTTRGIIKSINQLEKMKIITITKKKGKNNEYEISQEFKDKVLKKSKEDNQLSRQEKEDIRREFESKPIETPIKEKSFLEHGKKFGLN